MSRLKLSFGLLVAFCAVASAFTTNAKTIFAACAKTVTITNPNPDVVFNQGAAFSAVSQYQGRTDSQISNLTEDTQNCDGLTQQFCCATKANATAPVQLIWRSIP